MSSFGMAALHAGLIERARAPDNSTDWDSTSNKKTNDETSIPESRSEEMKRAPSSRAVELTPMRTPEIAKPVVPQPPATPTVETLKPDEMPSTEVKTPRRRKGDSNPIRYAINRKGNLLQKRKYGARTALTLRVEKDVYKRLVQARQGMGRTSQDILETALVLYLNLLGIDESDD